LLVFPLVAMYSSFLSLVSSLFDNLRHTLDKPGSHPAPSVNANLRMTIHL
jgi:hypothetical protein